MPDRRILIVAYWFPPAGGISVQRALSLARYLPQHGFEVHVLTPRNPPASVLDPALLSSVPDNVTVHRAWTPMPPAHLRNRLWSLISRKRPAKPVPGAAPGAKPSPARGGRFSNFIRRILCPDPEVVWVPFATRRARQIVKRHRIDTVLVTAPPFSAFLIGNALKREFPDLRLISDFRDEWLRFFLSTFEFQSSPHIRERAAKIERTTVEASDVVITVTSSLVDELRTRYSDQPASKFLCIPNGYDPAVFANFHPRSHPGSKVVMTYVGTVYSTASPRPFFEALDELPAALRERIETHFVGRVAADQRELLESRTGVKLLGFLPQAKALNEMEDADYLLLFMNDPTGVTGKIYEYLSTGKPIVAFSPRGGEVDLTLRETGGGWCIDPSDKEAMQSCLSEIAAGTLARKFHPNREAIRRYERPQLAGVFADAIRSAGATQPAVTQSATVGL